MNDFFAFLEENIADEAEARKNYYLLLEKYGKILTRTEREIIIEIISEELKHSEILSQIIYNRNRIKAED